MDADDLTLADIRRWYHEHGVPYEEEDWGERADTGESIGPQTQEPEKATDDRGWGMSVRSSDPSPARSWWWEEQRLVWEARSREEQDWLDLLDQFFAPYIAMLPRPKGNLVRQVFNDLSSYTKVGQENRMARQSAHEAVVRAVRDLTRLIANDDPLFRPPADRRRRDFEEEARAARRVFMVYVAKDMRRAH